MFAWQMTKTVSVAAAAAEAEKQKRNKAGLDAVLASLQAAKKVNILDKSRSDWSTFKTSNTKACCMALPCHCLIFQERLYYLGMAWLLHKRDLRYLVLLMFA